MASSDISQPTVYFVIPCFNEEDALPKTAQILGRKIRSLLDSRIISTSSRVLFVDDGSRDRTWEIIKKLHASYSFFGGVKLSHNRGHQNALFAGLMQALAAGCDAAISMDADLQDDIDAINQFVGKYREGAQIVYGVRNNRDTDTAFKRTTALGFYRLMNRMGTETVPNHADYRLMSKQALKALSQFGEENLFLRGIVPSIGFKTDKVYYKRGERVAGESKYPLKKMIAFAIDGITSFSTEPLRLITMCGIFTLIVSIIMLIYTIVSVASGHAVAGWGSIMVSLWFIGGLIMTGLGIVGEYIGKIYIEAKGRPRYIIEETL